LVNLLRKNRPVFLDTGTMDFFRTELGYRADGLVGEVVDGTGPQTNSQTAELSQRLLQDDIADGRGSGPAHARFPSTNIQFLYARAHVELAKQYALRHDVAGIRTELDRATEDYPYDNTMRLAAKYAGQATTPVENLLKVVAAL
jgi:hypothetical protein